MIVAFGTFDAARHPRIRVMIQGLRAQGYKVYEVNQPLGFTTAQRVQILREPWRLPLFAARLLYCWGMLVVQTVRHRGRYGSPRAVLVGYLGHFDVVLARLLFPRTTILLDHLVFAGETAVDRGARGLRVRLLRGLDRLATACADVVVVDTQEHLAMLRGRRRGVVVPVGATDAWFDARLTGPGSARGPADGPEDGTLRVAFWGLYTPLHGTTVIAEALARALPRAASLGARIEVTMIGHGQDLDEVTSRLAAVDGITWLHWVEPHELPRIVAGHDVCLGIFSETPKGRRVVPNKVFQGLAAGCVVVTSDTAPQRRALGPYLELVAPGDAEALADRLVALTDRTELEAARKRAGRAASSIRPAAVVAPLVGALQGLPRGS